MTLMYLNPRLPRTPGTRFCHGDGGWIEVLLSLLARLSESDDEAVSHFHTAAL